jgi:hypothetical protein
MVLMSDVHWSIEVEVSKHDIVLLTEKNLHISMVENGGGESSPHVSPHVLISITHENTGVSEEELTIDDLELYIVLVGATDNSQFIWTCVLAADTHNTRGCDKTSATTCSMPMDCSDGFHHAVSHYQYRPRSWQGVQIVISSHGIHKQLGARMPSLAS